VRRTNSGTKLLMCGVCVLTALLIASITARTRQSPSAASAPVASPAPPLAAPTSPGSPTPVSSPGIPPDAGPCGCADIPEIQERIREAKAVIPLYQAEISRLQSNVPVPPYSSQQYNQFQSTLVPVLDALARQNEVSTFANGDTNMFCSVTPNPKASACMKSSTIKHENIHSAVCDKYGWSLSSGTWKRQIGLVAVYQNEIAAYQAELDFLEPLLAALTPSCSAGWKGEITSNFTITTNSNDPMPPMVLGLKVESTTTTYERGMKDKWMFSGLLGHVPQITQGKWSATFNSSRSLVEDSAFELEGKCAGKVLQGHLDIKDTATGSGTGRAALFVTIDGAVAHVNVIPNQNDLPGKITGSQTKQGWADILQNDCGHRVPSGSPVPVAEPSESFAQTGVDFDVPADTQHPGVLKGHLSKSVAGGGTTTLDWDLTLAAGPIN
jgi:hypothetical protein